MSKKALITGASSGIGKDMAYVLSEMGYEIIMTARRTDMMNAAAKELKTKSYIITADLSKRSECLDLYQKVMSICINDDLEIVINNAGFGLFGEFSKTDINTELKMIDTNISALHILTKLFLGDFIKKDSGYILNVASSAAFLPGPLMSTYYSTKAYVLRLSQAIDRELKHSGSHVYVGALCPGPVSTEFNNVAGVKFVMKSLNSRNVAEYAVKKMIARKTVIIPGAQMKAAKLGLRLIPDKLITRISYRLQSSKG